VREWVGRGVRGVDYVADGEGNKGERDRSDEVGRAVFLQQLLGIRALLIFAPAFMCV
jgi:hypothetical protein